MNMYGFRTYSYLFTLLFTTSILMAQSQTINVRVSWEPPSQANQDFDHYRLYYCNKPMTKNGTEVTCNETPAEFADVEKDKLKVNIEYALPEGDTLYIAAVTRRGTEESDLSKQVSFKPSQVREPGRAEEIDSDSVESLANSYYLKNTSDNFKDTHPVERLWDRCEVLKPACTAGSNESQTVWIEFDFERPRRLTDASLYGDTEGSWQSQSWSLSYKLEEADPWKAAFTNASALVNDWVRQELVAVSARYVRVEIFGLPDSQSVQARELEILGQRLEEQ